MWHRPQIWLVATAEDRELQRAWLNRVISALSEPGRSKVTARFREDAHFLATYTELATAAVLTDAGVAVEYEREYEGKTPDFTVLNGSSPSLLVEVYTKFRSEERRATERAWMALQTRIQAIPVPVVLTVVIADRRRSSAPDDRTAKQIVRQLRDWLLEAPTPARDGRLIEGYQFLVAGRVPGLYATCSIPGSGGWFDSDMVLRAINDKVKVYASLADRFELPLLVVLASEPASPLKEELVRSALKGDMTMTLSFDPFERGSEPHTVSMRPDRTPASFAPCLSAVGWMNPGIDEPGSLIVFPVPSARRPVPLASAGSLIVAPP